MFLESLLVLNALKKINGNSVNKYKKNLNRADKGNDKLNVK